jgi:hypothetical protein
MAVRILHFGQEFCHRLPVLKSAGYRVDECVSISQLQFRFQSGFQPDAVSMAEYGGSAPVDAVPAIRSFCSAPLILFRETNLVPNPNGEGDYDGYRFDLVIPALTQPSEWLDEIAAVIHRSHLPR